MYDWRPLVSVKIPIDPRARRPPRFVAGKPPYKPKPERDYEATLRAAIAAKYCGEPSRAAIQFAVAIYFRRPRKPPKKMTERPTKRPDGDNVFKACADACNKLVFVDDSQIVEGHFTRWWGDAGCIFIDVREWADG